MKIVTKLLAIAVFCLVILSAYIVHAAQTHTATLQWTTPTTMSGTSCSITGDPIPVGKTTANTVQWRIKNSGAAWGAPNSAETTASTYTVTGLTPETTYEFRVGTHYIGVAVGCWAYVEATTPAYASPSVPTGVTVTVN